MSEVNVEAGGLDVRQEEEGRWGAFYVEQGGRRVAELAYEREGADRALLQHTQVSDALRGQGVARRLVDAAVAWARASGTRLVPLCPYAKAIFDRDASLRDVLV
nr:GNAT family N-acetyltransferase [Anaeromyxobacter sp. Fw109-5]